MYFLLIFDAINLNLINILTLLNCRISLTCTIVAIIVVGITIYLTARARVTTAKIHVINKGMLLNF